ncbi:galactinol--sucrose galactosyltransferase [Salvia divinorum]|uniref:Galactinol--sucrose galactosyltransferase n=1 Tax=Salvia divinorum TaxID=28513 RepID=A0ABD1IFR3_SALDI
MAQQIKVSHPFSFFSPKTNSKLLLLLHAAAVPARPTPPCRCRRRVGLPAFPSPLSPPPPSLASLSFPQPTGECCADFGSVQRQIRERESWRFDFAHNRIAAVVYNSVFLGEVMITVWDVFLSLYPTTEYPGSILRPCLPDRPNNNKDYLIGSTCFANRSSGKLKLSCATNPRSSVSYRRIRAWEDWNFYLAVFHFFSVGVRGFCSFVLVA